VTIGLAYRQVNSAPEIGVRNSQPEGIGRVVALGDLICWNNLGRNVVFADHRFRPRRVFGTTLFPGQDEPSQYDLDVHSILEVPELGLILVMNHYGTVRGFRCSDILRRYDGIAIEPTSLWSFVADVERTIVVAGRLVGSVPRSEGAVGLLVSAPLDGLPSRAKLPTQEHAAAFGEVTAVGVVPRKDGPLIAIGGESNVALLPFVGDRVRGPAWEAEVGFRVASLTWHEGALFAAGPDCAGPVDDYEWERLRGGGFALLSPTDGRTILCGQLPDDVAWGTGGVAVAPLGRMMVAAGRTGRLHLIDLRSLGSHRATNPLTDTSLGIAHLAVVGRRVLCGFNRGGYYLHSFTQSAAGADDP
jgi:hypothetical protein